MPLKIKIFFSNVLFIYLLEAGVVVVVLGDLSLSVFIIWGSMLTSPLLSSVTQSVSPSEDPK